MRVHVHGAGGRMGQMACAALREADGFELAGQSGRGDDLARALAAARPDALVEFTRAEALVGHLDAALDAGVHVVSGTTGAQPAALAERAERGAALGLAVMVIPNFSVAVALMQRWAREAVRYLPHVEIVESHHDQKRDAPSGTARATAEQLDGVRGPRVEGDELLAGARGAKVGATRIHSVRLPGLLAHQEVLMANGSELLTLRHDSWSRDGFAPGLLLALRRTVDRPGGTFGLEPLLADEGGDAGRKRADARPTR